MPSTESAMNRLVSLLPYLTVPAILLVLFGGPLGTESTDPLVRYAFAVVFGFGALCGAVGAMFGIVELGECWRMWRLDPSGASTDRVGIQTVEGSATPVGETVTAPFTGRESLIYRCTVEYNRNGDASWTTVEQTEESTPFEIEHTGPTVAVDPADAQQLLSTEYQIELEPDEDPPDRLERRFEELSEKHQATWKFELGSFYLSGSEPELYRFTEKRLDPGETVHVIGETGDDPTAIPAGSTAPMTLTPAEHGWRDRLLGRPFIISDITHTEARKRKLKRAAGLLVPGLVLTGLFSAFVGPLVLGILG